MQKSPGGSECLDLRKLRGTRASEGGRERMVQGMPLQIFSYIQLYIPKLQNDAVYHPYDRHSTLPCLGGGYLSVCP